MITAAQLRALKTADPDAWAPLISAAIWDNAITEIPCFLANVLHECGRLRTLRESLNYTPAALVAEWPSRFNPTTAAAMGRTDKHAADQYSIAETAYGGRFGNGPPMSGDGFRFRGAGGLQTTFKANVIAFGKAIGWTGTLDELLAWMATPAGAAASAGQYWRAKKIDALPNPKSRRLAVNGGLNGWDEVNALRAEVIRALGVSASLAMAAVLPPRPAAPVDLTADDLNARSLQQIRNA